MVDYIKRAAAVVPAERQLAWNKHEFYGFIHFGVNTFTDREWGMGTEDPAIFNPLELDTDQWVRAIKSAGMVGVIITAKHHDGFCLWPSEYTEHCVKNSPVKTDIVASLAESCRKEGLKFGVYLSPWDRHEATYGDSPAYNKYYKQQLVELLTNYGELFEIWFDGACGEGPNGKRQVYDWAGIIEICRQYQPNACLFNTPDIRWCGNEAGDCREDEWSVVPKGTGSDDVFFDIEGQQTEEDSSGEFRARKLLVDQKDLGSREIIKDGRPLIWSPCETNTSIRPGWFYHSNEDDKVRSLDELMDIYYASVGGNSSFLLNIPPNKDGLLHENDVKRLAEIGERLNNDFYHDLTDSASISFNGGDVVGFEVANILKKDDSSWTSENLNAGEYIEIDFANEVELDKIVLQEDLRHGQRIEKYTVEAQKGDAWEHVFEGSTIGNKRIKRFDKTICTSKLRITITQCRTTPYIKSIRVYRSK